MTHEQLEWTTEPPIIAARIERLLAQYDQRDRKVEQRAHPHDRYPVAAYDQRRTEGQARHRSFANARRKLRDRFSRAV